MAKSNAALFTDIRLQLGDQRYRPVYTTATEQRLLATPEGGSRNFEDFALAEGDDNLGQAVIMRLLSPRGELAELGHPTYGSRLHELIGSPNTETTRNRVRLYILEALAHERRVEAIERVTVSAHPQIRDAVDVALSLRPVASSQILNLGPLTLRLQS